MATYVLPYGQENQTLEISSNLMTSVILPKTTPAARDPKRMIETALEKPLGFSWSKITKSNTIAITINDKTRPVPNHILLPPLLEQLASLGVQRENITLWIATGSHQPMASDEFPRILPLEIIDAYKVLSHEIDNTENLTLLGSTRAGTPVWVNTAFYQSNIKIVVGDIEPHHFAGFSGGYKSAAIGMAGRPTINHNHKMLTDPNSWIGVYQSNPLRQDIEEIGSIMGIDLALNAVLNQDKEIVAVFSGHPLEVIRAAIPRVREICSVDQDEKFDLVIASAGGHPKDINFYQAQKALTHASMFCKPGGRIVLAAACPEGSGNRAYEDFMAQVHSLDQVFSLFAHQEFRVGPHKAFQVGRLLKSFEIVLVSSMPNGLVKRLLMDPAGSVQQAFDDFIATGRTNPQIAILPHATTTLAR